MNQAAPNPLIPSSTALFGWSLLVLLSAAIGCGGAAPEAPQSRFASASYRPTLDDLPELRELLRSGDHTERMLAANAIKQLGPDAKAAVPDLIHALGDYDDKTSVELKIYWNDREVPHRE